MAASSGTDNIMRPGANEQNMSDPPKVSAPDSESARAPTTSRKFTSLKSQPSQAIVVFDLSDDEDMLGSSAAHVPQSPSSHAHAQDTQNELASQSALARGIGELMSQMNPQNVVADEDAGTDVEVSPFQLPPDADQSD